MYGIVMTVNKYTSKCGESDSLLSLTAIFKTQIWVNKTTAPQNEYITQPRNASMLKCDEIEPQI